MEISNKMKIILSIALIIVAGIGFVVYLILNNSSDSELNLEDFLVNDSQENTTDGNVEKVNGMKDTNSLNTNQNNAITQEAITKIAIHIIGQVQKPGLIYLNEGARIADAIEEAGGETKEADLSQVNLAYILQDGQKIYIPNKKEKITTYIIQDVGNNGVVEDNSNINLEKGENKKVNINTANQTELDELPGIGDSIAQRIIDYREQNGSFKSIEELKEVKGIGDAKFEEIREHVTV